MTSPYPSTSPWTKDEPNKNSGTPSTSTIRPRIRRLISTEEEEVVVRNLSPLPAPHPSRTSSGSGGGRINGRLTAGTGNGSLGRSGGSRAQSPGFGRGLFEGGWTGSWTTLQGLASSVLGGDVEGDSGANKAGSTRRRKQNRLATAPALAEWGPTGLSNKGKDKDTSGAATLAARNSAVNVLKTASVMQSHENINGGLPVSKQKHKRRTSDDLANVAIADDEGDALVYVHHVKPTDTLAGVILRYNCDPAIFRKANRLWPNDAIQVRKTVLVPVDACAVRGKPCPAPSREPIDLLAPTPIDEEPPNLAHPDETSPWANGILSSSSSEQGHHIPEADAEAHPWIHVRWVLLSPLPSAEPTEIARLPRKTLGYFPPRRRKSQATLSPFATPRASIDVASPATSPTLPGRGVRRLSNLSASTGLGSYFPSPTMSAAASRGTSTTRGRRESVSEAAQRANWFRGPGGVGTFGPDVRRPGPAQDGLNSWARRHVPGLTIGDLPSSSGGPMGGGFEEEGVVGAAGPGGDGGGGGGIEAAAAAIEGWVRRMGNRPVTPMGPGGKRQGVGQGEEVGDLIELLDGAGSDDGRGFEVVSGAGAGAGAGGGSGSGSAARAGVRGRKGGKTE